MPDDTPKTEANSQFYGPYAEFSKTVRTWFVGFGIGGPVVLLANEKAWQVIVASGCSRDIGLLFLIGGALQVVCALLNKHAMWHLYFSEADPTDSAEEKTLKEQYRQSRVYQIASWYSEQNWIDELLDLYSLVVFGWGTILAVFVLCPPHGMKFVRFFDESSTCWTIGPLVAASIFAVRLFKSFRQA